MLNKKATMISYSHFIIYHLLFEIFKPIPNRNILLP